MQVFYSLLNHAEVGKKASLTRLIELTRTKVGRLKEFVTWFSLKSWNVPKQNENLLVARNIKSYNPACTNAKS